MGRVHGGVSWLGRCLHLGGQPCRVPWAQALELAGRRGTRWQSRNGVQVTYLRRFETMHGCIVTYLGTACVASLSFVLELGLGIRLVLCRAARSRPCVQS